MRKINPFLCTEMSIKNLGYIINMINTSCTKTQWLKPQGQFKMPSISWAHGILRLRCIRKAEWRQAARWWSKSHSLRNEELLRDSDPNLHSCWAVGGWVKCGFREGWWERGESWKPSRQRWYGSLTKWFLQLFGQVKGVSLPQIVLCKPEGVCFLGWKGGGY